MGAAPSQGPRLGVGGGYQSSRSATGWRGACRKDSKGQLVGRTGPMASLGSRDATSQGSIGTHDRSQGLLALLSAYSAHCSSFKPCQHTHICRESTWGNHLSPANAPYQREHCNHLITLKAALLFPILPIFFCLLTCFHRHFGLPVMWKPDFKDKAVAQIFIPPLRIS